MPTSADPEDQRDPVADTDHETREVIIALLAALEEPGAIDAGYAAWVRVQLQALLDASESARLPRGG